MKMQKVNAEREIKEQKKVIDQLMKEIDQYKRELLRKEKSMETQLKTAQEAQRSLYETQGKLQNEIKRLRDELNNWKEQNKELQQEIDLAGDAMNQIKLLQGKVKDKDSEINLLQNKLIEVAKDMNTETLMLQKLQNDNEVLQQEVLNWKNAYDEEHLKVDSLEP